MKEYKRNYLQTGQRIVLAQNPDGTNREVYCIISVEGEGSSVVCYNAVRESDRQKGKLKEFYPDDMALGNGVYRYHTLKRLDNGQLVPNTGTERRFDTLCRDYLKTYGLLIKIINDDPQNEILKNFIQMGDVRYGCPSACLEPGGVSPDDIAYESYDRATVYIWSSGIFGQRYDERLSEMHKNLEEKPARKLYEILLTIYTLTDCIRSLHTVGLLHLDIKPANFLVPYRGDMTVNPGSISMFDVNTFYFVDGEFPQMAGTDGFQAPELSDGQVDNRSDIYSIGAMLFYAITDGEAGRAGKLYRDEYYKKLPDFVKNSKLVLNACLDAGMVSDLGAILKKCLAENLGKRYRSCNRLLVELRRVKDRAAEYAARESQSEVNKRNIWNGARSWLENGKKEGQRFSWLNIDETIMPYGEKMGSMKLPFYVSDNKRRVSDIQRVPLMEAITKTRAHLYLIGQGGIGKTTALMDIMERAYSTDYVSTCQVPLFVDLSYAPDTFGKQYAEGKSSFIRRSIYRLLCAGSRSGQSSGSLLTELENVYNAEPRVAVEPVTSLFMQKPEGAPEYFLLLDGLNEVSRAIVNDENGNQLSSIVAMVIFEIRELLRCPNVRVVLTSRSDEGFMYDENFTKLYLTGISNAEICNYLEKRGFSAQEVKATSTDKKLMETLEIPLFLTMYASLRGRGELCTRGDILRTFFNEKGSRFGIYTLQNRIRSAEENRKETGNAAGDKNITAREQWFILDILLPEIAWNMERNDKYYFGMDEIWNIIRPVLNGREDTDICGRYGRRLFSKFSTGSDLSSHTGQIAGRLLALGKGDKQEKTVESILECCVFSLGIMQEQRGMFGFVHQHIRDYLAAKRIINSLEMAVFLHEEGSLASFDCLKDFNSEPVSKMVRDFIGESLQECRNCPILQEGKWKPNLPACSCGRNLLERTLELYRKIFYGEVGYGVWNILRILSEARGSLAGENLSELDLRRCNLNGVKLFNADFYGALVNKETLFAEGHFDDVTGVEFSSDGRYLITCSRDGSIKQWDVRTLRCIKTIKTYPAPVEALAWSHDGQYIAVSVGNIEVIRVSTMEIVLNIKNAFNPVFSRDGRYFAVAAEGIFKKGEVQVYDGETFQYICSPGRIGIGKGNSKIAFYGDKVAYAEGRQQRYVCAGSKEDREYIYGTRKIIIWNIITRKMSHVLQCPQRDGRCCGWISGIDYSSTGRFLAAVITETIVVWDIREKRRAVLECKLEESDYFESIVSVKFAVNDKFLLAGVGEGSDVVIVFENKGDFNYQYYGRLKGFPCTTGNISCLNNRVAVGTLEGVKIWNLNTLKMEGSLWSVRNYVQKAVFHPKKELVAIIGNGDNVQLWNVKTGICERELEGESDYAYTMDVKFIYPEGDRVAVATVDQVKIYDFHSFECIQTIATDNGSDIRKIDISKDGRYLLTYPYYSNCGIRLFDLENNEDSFEKNFGITKKTTAKFYPDGNSVLISIMDEYTDPLKLALWDINKRDYRWRENIEGEKPYKNIFGPILQICYEPNKKYIALRLRGGGILLYDEMYKCCIAAFGDGDWHFSQLRCRYRDGMRRRYKDMEFSKEGTILLAVTWNGDIDMWDMVNFEEIKTRNLRGKRGNVRYAEFSPNDKYILTADGDYGTVRIWETNSMKCIKTFKFVSGLRVQGADLSNLHLNSNLSKEDLEILRMYGAKID